MSYVRCWWTMMFINMLILQHLTINDTLDNKSLGIWTMYLNYVSVVLLFWTMSLNNQTHKTVLASFFFSRKQKLNKVNYLLTRQGFSWHGKDEKGWAWKRWERWTKSNNSYKLKYENEPINAWLTKLRHQWNLRIQTVFLT